tara:strand:- start:214 stop:525 length:312 start_codon:yes stop_codon:yes gene_type:complete
MSDDEYILYIQSCVNRLINENHVSVVNSEETGPICIKIQCAYPEWYLELDDDIKYNVETNLQRHFKRLIKKKIKSHNEQLKKDKDTDGDDGTNHESKKQRLVT